MEAASFHSVFSLPVQPAAYVGVARCSVWFLLFNVLYVTGTGSWLNDAGWNSGDPVTRMDGRTDREKEELDLYEFSLCLYLPPSLFHTHTHTHTRSLSMSLSLPHSVSVSVCLSVCLSVCVCLSLSVSVSVSLSLSVSSFPSPFPVSVYHFSIPARLFSCTYVPLSFSLSLEVLHSCVGLCPTVVFLSLEHLHQSVSRSVLVSLSLRHCKMSGHLCGCMFQSFFLLPFSASLEFRQPSVRL